MHSVALEMLQELCLNSPVQIQRLKVRQRRTEEPKEPVTDCRVLTAFSF